MKCYFCGKDCLSDSDAVLSINCKTLIQSEIFRAPICGSCTDAVMRGMLNVPSADVQPVVHAYWIELPKALNPNENPCKCSNCGHILSFMNGYPKSKYCDECGARMDSDIEGINNSKEYVAQT